MTSGTAATGVLCPWDSPGKNTGVGCHSLLQGIFPTQESNPGLLHCRQILYHLSHQGRLLKIKRPHEFKDTVVTIFLVAILKQTQYREYTIININSYQYFINCVPSIPISLHTYPHIHTFLFSFWSVLKSKAQKSCHFTCIFIYFSM